MSQANTAVPAAPPAPGTAPLPRGPAAAPAQPSPAQLYGALHMPPVAIGDHDFGDEETVLVSVPKAFKVNVTFPGKGSRLFDLAPGVQRVPARLSPGDGNGPPGPDGWYLKAHGCRVLQDNDQVQRAAYELRTTALAASRGGSHPLHQTLPPVPGAPGRAPEPIPYPAYQIPAPPAGISRADWDAHLRVVEAARNPGPDSRTLTADPDWEEKLLADERALHSEPAAAERRADADAGSETVAADAKAPASVPAPPAAPKPANGGKLNPATLAGDKPDVGAQEKKS